MSVKLKLIFVLSALACALLLIGSAGYLGLMQMSQKTQTIVADRLVPIEQLTTVRKEYLSISTQALKVIAGTLSFEDAAASVQKSNAVAARRWGEYLATYLTPEEAGIAEKTKRAMMISIANLSELGAVLTKKDLPAYFRNPIK